MRYTRSAVAIAAAMSLLLVACGEDANDEFGATTAPAGAAVEDTAVGPEDGSSLQTTDPSETTVAPPSTDAAGEVDEQSPNGVTPVTGTRTEVDPIAVEGPAGIIEGQHWLLPWRDGFVSVRIEIGQQASPSELPEELAELIPQEVWDLFPDGLPPTLAEAQQIISDAGLLDVVIDAMAENKALSDAIYSGETPTEVTADFTTDGVAWESLPIELPVDATSVQQVVGTADGIALFGDRTAEDDTSPEYYVATSNGSFEDWSVETLAASPVDDFDGIFNVSGFGSFAANDDRWIARFTSEVGVNVPAVLRRAGIEHPDRLGYVLRHSPEALMVHPPIFVAWEDIGLSWAEGQHLVPDEVLELAGIDLGNTEEFPGWMTDSEGMTIDLDPADIGAAGGDAVTVAWEDTDLSAEQVTALREVLDALGPDPYMTLYQATTEYWSAEWGGEPTYTGPDDDGPWSDIHAVETGFLQHAEERLEFTTDGVSWAPVDGAPADHEVVGTMPIDDGTVVLMNGWAGDRVFLVSPDMQHWQEVLVDGLPPELHGHDDQIDSSAEVVFGPHGVRLLATADGETWIFDSLVSDDGSEETSAFPAARNGSTVLVFGPDGWARYEMGG